MNHRHAISVADWERVKDLLPGRPGQHGGVAKDNRQFLDAVLWIARTGAACRDLPAPLGHWNSQWRRFDRWAKAGRFAALAAVLCDPELDVLILDSAAVRAHLCAAGAKKKWDGSGGQKDQALGRSRGGFGTKIRGSFDGLGHPRELLVTAAQESDIAQAETLLADHRLEVVIADKGYDKKALVEAIESRGAQSPLGSYVRGLLTIATSELVFHYEQGGGRVLAEASRGYLGSLPVMSPRATLKVHGYGGGDGKRPDQVRCGQ